MTGHTFATRAEEIDFCNAYNEIKVPYLLLPFGELIEEKLFAIFREWSMGDYDIDGLVLDVNDTSLYGLIGRETSTNNPGWARAYKGKFEVSYGTKISDIEYNVSKFGVINPRLQLEPVVIDGNTITSTYPDNARSVVFYDMKPGDQIQMIRAGQVIPRMSEVNGKPYKPAQIPRDYVPNKMPIAACPCCGGALQWDANNVQLVCIDLDKKCSAQNLSRVIAFFEIVGIKFLSDSTFEEFFKRGYDTVGKIYGIPVSEMASWPKWGQSRAENAKLEIGKTLGNLRFITVMHASSFFQGLGSKKLVLAEDILRECYNTGAPLPVGQLSTIEGYGLKSAQIIADGWDNFKKFVIDNSLKLIFAEQKEKVVATGDQFKGQVYLFSGFRDKDLTNIIQTQGGQVVDSYSKKVTHLILQDLNSTSSKTKKAKDDGVTILSRQQMTDSLSGSSIIANQSQALW